jgi:hypothetical protein
LWCGLVTGSGQQDKRVRQQVQPTQCLACGEWEQVSSVSPSLTYAHKIVLNFTTVSKITEESAVSCDSKYVIPGLALYYT